MAIDIHIQRDDGTTSYTDLARLRELFPPGNGYVEIKPNGDIVLSQPSGGGGNTSTSGLFTETLTVTTTNVLPAPSFKPKYTNRDFFVTIGSWVRHSVTEGGFTVNTTAPIVSIVAGAQYSVLAGWTVTYEYATDDDTSPPTITAVSPASVTVGQVLTITGTGFTNNAVVTLGGQVVPFTLVSQTQITVTLPALLYAGTAVLVQTVTGQATNSGFNFVPSIPTITSFAPVTALASATVVITGTNFYGTPTVRFGGVVSPTVVVNSPTQITATVPSSGASGNVEVQTVYGNATRAGFTWEESQANIILVPVGGNSVRAVRKSPRGVLSETFPAVSGSVRPPVYALGRWFVPMNSSLLLYNNSYALTQTVSATTLGVGVIRRIFFAASKIVVVGQNGVRFGTLDGSNNWQNGALLSSPSGINDGDVIGNLLYLVKNNSPHNLELIDIATSSSLGVRNFVSESYTKVVAGNAKIYVMRSDGIARVFDVSSNNIFLWTQTGVAGNTGSGVLAFAANAFWYTEFNLLRRIDTATLTQTTLSLPGLSSSQNGIIVQDGLLVVADTGNNRLVFVDPVTQTQNGSAITGLTAPYFTQL